MPRSAPALQQEIEDLEQRIHKLKLEHDIMVKAAEIVRKDPGINPRDLTNRGRPPRPETAF